VEVNITDAGGCNAWGTEAACFCSARGSARGSARVYRTAVPVIIVLEQTPGNLKVHVSFRTLQRGNVLPLSDDWRPIRLDGGIWSIHEREWGWCGCRNIISWLRTIRFIVRNELLVVFFKFKYFQG